MKSRRLMDVIRAPGFSVSVTAGVLLLTSFLSGCATTQEDPTPPAAAAALQVRVHWSTQAEILQRCNKAGGCSTSGAIDDGNGEIWAQKPSDFDDDDKVCAVGDLLLGLLEDAAVRANLAQAQTGGNASRSSLTGRAGT